MWNQMSNWISNLYESKSVTEYVIEPEIAPQLICESVTNFYAAILFIRFVFYNLPFYFILKMTVLGVVEGNRTSLWNWISIYFFFKELKILTIIFINTGISIVLDHSYQKYQQFGKGTTGMSFAFFLFPFRWLTGSDIICTSVRRSSRLAFGQPTGNDVSGQYKWHYYLFFIFWDASESQ